jgi:hypothetical protein
MLPAEEVRMRPKCCVTGWMLIVLGLIACGERGPAAEAPAAPAAKPAESVRIEKKTETLKREAEKEAEEGAEEEAEKGREADVHYPVFSGLPPAVLKELQASAGLKAGTETSLEEWRAEFQDSWWLVEIDYEVTYNRHGILCLTYRIDGMGAYPNTSTADLAADLQTGRRLTAKDLFKPAALEELAAKVDRLRSAAVEKATQENRAYLEGNQMTEEDLMGTMDQAVKSRFGVENLDRFRLDDKGVTFVYDFEFPHVNEAFEPSGEFFVSYEELRPYINPEGPLTRLVVS